MHKKEEFYGVWGRMRADFLREKNPAVYRRLKESGNLISYLEGYQQAFSKRADVLGTQLSEERGLTDALLENNALEWLLLSAQIHEEILRRLREEIQR